MCLVLGASRTLVIRRDSHSFHTSYHGQLSGRALEQIEAHEGDVTEAQFNALSNTVTTLRNDVDEIEREVDEEGDIQGAELANCVITIDETRDVTKTDWDITPTGNSEGIESQGDRLSLRTRRVRNESNRLGYMFRLEAVLGGSTPSTIGEAIFLPGQPDKLVMNLFAAPVGNILNGSLDINISYGRNGGYADFVLAAQANIDSAWTSTTLTQEYTMHVHNLEV